MRSTVSLATLAKVRAGGRAGGEVVRQTPPWEAGGRGQGGEGGSALRLACFARSLCTNPTCSLLSLVLAWSRGDQAWLTRPTGIAGWAVYFRWLENKPGLGGLGGWWGLTSQSLSQWPGVLLAHLGVGYCPGLPWKVLVTPSVCLAICIARVGAHGPLLDSSLRFMAWPSPALSPSWSLLVFSPKGASLPGGEG